MSYIGKIAAGGGTHSVASTLYGTCGTAAGTKAKVVSCADFDALIDGVTIHVKFTNSNAADAPTLNVNSTGAKEIRRYGSTVPGKTEATSWPAGSVVTFTYDGTYWNMNGNQNVIGSVSYGVCSTPGGTAAKTVEIQDFVLQDGATIFVKFTEANTAGNPTLNVNNLGAKALYQYGTTRIGVDAETTGWNAGAVVCFIYDGTGWIRNQGHNTNTSSTYTNASLGQGYGTCNTPTATAAKVVVFPDYELVEGGFVAVQFSNAVGLNATMSINNKGSKSIYYNGSPITAGIIKAGDVGTFVYSDEIYNLVSVDRWGLDINELVTNVGSHTVATDVPTGAVFTDTTYDFDTATIGSASAGTEIAADDITNWNAGTMTTVSYANEVLTFTNGTAPTLTYTARSIPNITVTSTTVVTDVTSTTSGI